MTEDRISFDHHVTAWTVGQLRESLDGAEDDAIVTVMVQTEPWSAGSAGYVAVSAETDRPISGAHTRPGYVLHCSLPSGAYLKPRSGRLSVAHGDLRTAEEIAAHEGLLTAVDEATGSLGAVGEHSRELDPDQTVTSWTWHSHTVPVQEILEVAKRTAAATNPYGWMISVDHE